MTDRKLPLPGADEVLLCTEHTTLEDVSQLAVVGRAILLLVKLARCRISVNCVSRWSYFGDGLQQLTTVARFTVLLMQTSSTTMWQRKLNENWSTSYVEVCCVVC